MSLLLGTILVIILLVALSNLAWTAVLCSSIPDRIWCSVHDLTYRSARGRFGDYIWWGENDRGETFFRGPDGNPVLRRHRSADGKED